MPVVDGRGVVGSVVEFDVVPDEGCDEERGGGGEAEVNECTRCRVELSSHDHEITHSAQDKHHRADDEDQLDGQVDELV